MYVYLKNILCTDSKLFFSDVRYVSSIHIIDLSFHPNKDFDIDMIDLISAEFHTR